MSEKDEEWREEFLPSQGRIIVFSGIHSALPALESLINQIKPTALDEFIFLGNYFNSWSKCVETLKYLMDFSNTYKCVFIEGRFDSRWGLKGWLESGNIETLWARKGGQKTLEQFSRCFDETPEMKGILLKFLKDLKPYYIDSENRAYVHGGFTSDKGLNDSLPTELIWDSSLVQNTVDLAELGAIRDSRLNLYKEIYVGGVSTITYGEASPINHHNLWLMETGAGDFGRLTALDVASKECWYSKFTKRIFPAEYVARIRDFSV